MREPSPESPGAGEVVTQIDLPLRRMAAGKVREMFELDESHLLMVATDRISAYDVVMDQGIPAKGRVLTALSVFWFGLLEELCPNHMVSADFSDLPESLRSSHPQLAGRSMIVHRLEMLQLEFVVRGYLVGSGWKEYLATGSVCGVSLPPGLREADKLPEPIFTPATKAHTGHDENISAEAAAKIIGADRLDAAAAYALELYGRAADHALQAGIILADTKFEFGTRDGQIVLGDEALTPDSSRFWPADAWSPGKSPPSFDKQYLRDWLDGSGWDRNPPPPPLPEEVVAGTSSRYVEAYERLTAQ